MNAHLPTANGHTWRARLAAALVDSGRSKRDVSRAAGLSDNYIQQIFKDGKEPSVSNLIAIAAELGTSVSSLCGEDA